jgi:hypothetical protein
LEPASIGHDITDADVPEHTRGPRADHIRQNEATCVALARSANDGLGTGELSIGPGNADGAFEVELRQLGLTVTVDPVRTAMAVLTRPLSWKES